MVRRAFSSDRWRTVGAAVAVTGLVGLPVSGVFSPPARADEVPGAITSVDLVDERVDRYATMRLTLIWAVPDSAEAGDTFELTLPPELEAVDGAAFDLRDTAGERVATALVRDGLVTFTLTDYVDTHTDVRGSAWFEVSFADSVEIGQELDLFFETTGRVFGDSVTVARVTGDYSTAATKWQRFADPDKDGPLTERDGILWALNAPRVTTATAGGDITFTDTPGPGQAIVCDSIDMFWGTKNSGGVDQVGFYGPDRYTKTCSPESVTITMKTYDTDTGRIPYLLGRSRITDSSLAEYRNSGTVRVHRGGTYTVGDTVEAGAGGDGEGLPPTEEPTATGSTTPTLPTGSPTTLIPGRPQPTATGPTVPTPTAEPTSTTTAPVSSGPPPGSGTPTVTATSTETVTLPGPVTTVTPPAVTVTVPPTALPTAGGTPTALPTAGTTPTSPPVGGGTPTSTTPAGAVPAPTTTPDVAGATPVSSVPRSRPARARAAATPTPRSHGSPAVRDVDRIDTGVPAAAAADPWLVGGGLALIGSSGLGLVVAGRRRGSTGDAPR